MNKSASNNAIPDDHDSRNPASLEWPMFTELLASVLSRLEGDQYLILSAGDSNRYVQFACKGVGGVRAEVTSNKFLEGANKLRREQMSWLRSHGWNAPTLVRDPKGSPNYYVDFPISSDYGEIARCAVEALMNALEIAAPSLLAYQALNSAGLSLSFEDLGLEPTIQQARNLLAGERRGSRTPTMFEEELGPLDEDDAEVKEEMFETMTYMGLEPKDLVDPQERQQYATWLVSNSSAAEEKAGASTGARRAK